MTGIYKIISPTGNVYIGQSINIEKRFREHKYYIHFNQSLAINRSFAKYGFDNHRLEVIHGLPYDVSIDVLNEYEKLYILQYKESGFIMLNMNEGGKNARHTEESKAKISSSNKGKIKTIDTRKKISEGNKGRVHPDSEKEKRNESIRNSVATRKATGTFKPPSQEAISNSVNKRKGTKLSIQHIANIKAAHAISPYKENMRKRAKNMALLNIGKKRTDEQRKKISEATKIGMAKYFAKKRLLKGVAA